MPAGGSSPLEAGNLYVYLIPSIFKEEHGPDREELPRDPLPAGSCFEDERGRDQKFHIFLYITPFSAPTNGYHDFYVKQYSSSYSNIRKG